jgi:hypothetical protein
VLSRWGTALNERELPEAPTAVCSGPDDSDEFALIDDLPSSMAHCDDDPASSSTSMTVADVTTPVTTPVTMTPVTMTPVTMTPATTRRCMAPRL